MKKQVYLLGLLFAAVGAFAQTSTDNIYYVKAGGTGDGRSWASPHPDLGAVLKAAKDKGGASTVYIAKGTYSPTLNHDFGTSTSTKDHTFRLPNNVTVYGGFNPDAGIITVEQRTFKDSDATILTADSGGTHHLVVMKDSNSAVLDGVTLKGGRADGNSDTAGLNRQYGGAVYVDKATLVLRNIKAYDNYAKQRGGAFYVEGDGKLKAFNSVLYNNTCDGDGSAVYGQNGNTQIYLVNSTIVRNKSNTDNNGGAVHVSNSADIYVHNSIIWNNTRNSGTITALTGGSQSDFRVSHSILNDNTENFSGDQYASNIWHYEPQFVDYNNNDFRIKSTGVGVNGGNSALYSTHGTLVTNVDYYGNNRTEGTIDIGAFEHQTPINRAAAYLYVDKNVAGGNGSGDSFVNAIKELSDVMQYTNIRTLNSSSSVPSTYRDNFNGVSIYVAKGEYTPHYSPNNFNHASSADLNSFLLSKNVQIIGSFAPKDGIENYNDRNLKNHNSVLKGNNHKHLVIAAGGNSSGAVLDGFYVTGGNASSGSNIDVNGESLNASFGGGIMVQGAEISLKNLVVRGNKAKDRGAGIYVEKSNGKIKISNSVIDHNIAGTSNDQGEGSGIYLNNGSQAIVVNTTVTQNITNRTSGGGALHVKDHGKFKIYNSIVWDNKNADATPKLLNLTGGDDSDFEVYNTIVNANSNPDGISGDGHNDGENSGKINFTTHNPMFVNAAGNDYTLDSFSPAINQGNTSYYTSNVGSTTDVDMYKNARLAGGKIDLGAFENQSPIQQDAANILYVDQNVIGGTGIGNSWANAIKDLGDALKWAYQQNAFNAFSENNPLKIYVAKGTYSPKFNPQDLEAGSDARARAYLLAKNVHVYGSFDPKNGVTTIEKRNILGDAKTIIEGNTNYHLIIAAGEESSNSRFDGFQLQNAHANASGKLKVRGHDIDGDKGAGVYVVNNDSNKSTKVVLKNIIAKDNKAYERGGFINADKKGTEVTLVNAIVHNNQVTDGGDGGSAIFSNNDAKVKILNSTIANNKNNGSNGGAVHVREEGSFDIYNSIIWNNHNKEGKLANMTGGEDNDFIVYNSIMNKGGNNGADSHENGDNTGKINYLTYDPQFVDAANGNYRLKSGSNPGINQGSNDNYNSLAGNHATDVDIEGKPRTIGNTIDMGAIEDTIPYVAGAGNVLYVKKGATGNGSAWGNEIGEVADALRWAKHRINLGGETLSIKVAKGEYQPMYSPINLDPSSDEKDNTFLMVNNVYLYGSYDPENGKVADTEVNVKNTPSILSGKETNYHVLLGAGDRNQSNLNVYSKVDGFVIEKGKAQGSGDITVNNSGINKGYGAGAYFDNSRVKINNSIFRNNDGKVRAGGLYAERDSDVMLSNTLMYDNKVNEEGSAIYATNGNTKVTIVNSTIADNQSLAGGDAGAVHLSSNADYYIYNSIVWNNKNKNGLANLTGGDSEDNGWNVYNSLINRKSNLKNNSDGHNDGENGGKINFRSYDPKFVNAAARDYSLQPTSPAIDKGNINHYIGESLNGSIDAYGNGRNYFDGIDIGAIEATKVVAKNISELYVNSSVSGGDKTGSTWANAMPNLADALQWVLRMNNNYTAANPLKIYVAKGIQNPMYSSDARIHRNSSGKPESDNSNEKIDSEFEVDLNGNARNHSFFIPNNVHIIGNYDAATGRKLNSENGHSETILSGLAHDSRHIVVAANRNNKAVDARIENVVIENGNGFGSGDLDGISQNYGGGVYVDNAVLNLKNVVVRNNKANERGGGIYLEGDDAKVYLSNSLVYNNTSVGDGSALYSNNDAKTNIINSTIVNNTSEANANGGALHVKDNGKFNVYNSIIWNNLRKNVQSSLSGGSSDDFKVSNTILNMGSTAHTNSSINYSTADPMFVDLQNEDFRLSKNSPALNRGNNNDYVDYSVGVNNLSTDTDIYGNKRLFGSAIDLGAYEYSETLGLDDVQVKSTRIYPNPTNGVFYIDVNSNEVVSIFNIAGQLVKTVNVKTGTNAIDITNLASGLYIVKTKTSGHKVIKK